MNHTHIYIQYMHIHSQKYKRFIAFVVHLFVYWFSCQGQFTGMQQQITDEMHVGFVARAILQPLSPVWLFSPS